MFKAMLGLYFVLIILHSCIGAEKALEELYAMQGDIKGITKSLVVDGLEDPYEVDISKLNRTNNFFQTKETKIIGGVEVPMHYFPFQAALYIYLFDGSNTFCGSSLISQNYVLTAAHCVMDPSHILVVLGAFDLFRDEATQLRMYASRYTYHAQWNTQTLHNDIAVLRLPTSVRYTVAIRPVQLPTYQDSRFGFENTRVMVVGWGKTSDYSDTASRLQYAETTIIQHEACTTYFPHITYAQLCVGGDPPIGPCNGDSGGPLVFNGKQLGIVSYGGRSCTAGAPSVFTRVSSYLRWITVNTDVIIF